MSSMSGAFGRVVLAAIFAFPIGGCATASQQSVVALPEGYYIQRDRSSELDLVKRGGSTVLNGPIAAYAVYRNLVVGCTGTWPPRSSGYPNEAAFPGSPDAKYFILDTKSADLQSGLSAEAWKQALARANVPQDIQLTAPLLF